MYGRLAAVCEKDCQRRGPHGTSYGFHHENGIGPPLNDSKMGEIFSAATFCNRFDGIAEAAAIQIQKEQITVPQISSLAVSWQAGKQHAQKAEAGKDAYFHRLQLYQPKFFASMNSSRSIPVADQVQAGLTNDTGFEIQFSRIQAAAVNKVS